MTDEEACALCGEALKAPGQVGPHHHTGLNVTDRLFERATFRDIVFDGVTRFDRCRFEGGARFENCVFTSYVSFAEARSEGLVAFRDTRFSNLVNLQDTEFAELSIRRSEFGAPMELELRGEAVDVRLTTFAGRSRLNGAPRALDLRRVVFRSGVQLRLSGTDVTMYDVEFGAPSSLGPWPGERRPALLEVTGTDLSQFSVSVTDLSRCTFAGAHNLDGIGVESLGAFALAPAGLYSRRRVLWDEYRWRASASPAAHRWHDLGGGEIAEDPPSPGLIARDYRALRKAREDAKDEPGAADFYYGEMEMRRMARREDMRQAARNRAWGEWITAATEHALLWLYWAVSGYGLRAWRSLVALLVMLTGAAVVFRYAGFPGDAHTYAASLRFAVQSAMSLLRGTDEPLTPTGEWVALALRLLGPLLFGLALLALRGRVRR